MTATDAARASRSGPNLDDSTLFGAGKSAALIRRPQRTSWFASALSPLAWLRRWKERRDLRRALELLDTPGMIEHAHVRDLMRLADLCVRGGEPGPARRAYRRAAHLFAADGHGQKSVSLLRQIALLDPYDANGRLDLARGLAEMGRRREAALEYQAGATLLESKLPLESLQLLSLALALDPGLPGARERIAELEQTRRLRVSLPDEDMPDEMPGDPIPPGAFALGAVTPEPGDFHVGFLGAEETPEVAGEYQALPDEAFVIEPTSLGETLPESDFGDFQVFGESDVDGSTFEDDDLPEDVTVAIELFRLPQASERSDEDDEVAEVEDDEVEEVEIQYAELVQADAASALDEFCVFDALDATREYGAAHVDLLVSCAMDTSHASVVIEEEERASRARRHRPPSAKPSG